jgi:hypothetical protein
MSYFGYIYLIQVESPSLDPKSVSDWTNVGRQCPSSTVDACEILHHQKDMD